MPRARKAWSPGEEAELARLYPDYPAVALAVTFRCSTDQVLRKAGSMGLEKSEAFKAGPHAGRWTGTEGIAYRHQNQHSGMADVPSSHASGRSLYFHA